MSVEIEQMVHNCSVCADYAKNQPSEPLKPSMPPSLPWKKIGTDLFEFHGEHYLLSVCYRSKFIEVTKLEYLRSGAVIEELKRQFGVHGIPAEVVSDNGPQFSRSEFEEFNEHYGFKHTPCHHIIQKPMEKWRELCKLLRSCGKKKTMTSTWPCWIIEQHHYQTLTCLQHNC